MNPKTFLNEFSEEERKELRQLSSFMPSFCGGYRLIKMAKSPQDLLERLRQLRSFIAYLKENEAG